MSDPGAAPLQAALPMYDSNPSQVEALWRALAARLADAGVPGVPPGLSWPADCLALWQAPDLLLSQTCGYPLVTLLTDKVRVVGAFHYAAPGCHGVLNRSQLVVRTDDPATTLADLRGRTLAYNGTESQSGYNSLRAMVAPLAVGGSFFGGRLATGAHHRSVAAVRDRLADIASIDCVSLACLARYSPELTRHIRVLDQSPPYPGLPLVTAAGTSDATLATLRAALQQLVLDPALAQVREDLFITGFEALDYPAYQVCLDMRDQALALGCATL